MTGTHAGDVIVKWSPWSQVHALSTRSVQVATKEEAAAQGIALRVSREGVLVKVIVTVPTAADGSFPAPQVSVPGEMWLSDFEMLLLEEHLTPPRVFPVASLSSPGPS